MTCILNNLNQLFIKILIYSIKTELKNATEGRVLAFSHDITPDMLRTKPDPEVEQRQNQFEQRALQVFQPISLLKF